jgi:low temperature requirement protein LtrA
VYAETEESLRHATWLELFFDLVFVVALAELGSYLHDHLTVLGLLQFAGLFAIVWWVWLGLSYYADTYATDDLLSRLLLIVAMFGVIFLSQTIRGALDGGSFAFAVSILFLRVLLTVGHLRALAMRSEARRFVVYWVGLEVLVTVVWGLSFVLSTAGITVVYLGFDTIEAQVSHFSERLGLFTILVLGETILSVSFGTSFVVLDVRTVVVGSLGFTVAVAAWWLYFNRFDETTVDWALHARPERWLETRQRGIVHIYGHYAIHAGIVAMGIGMEVALEAAHAHTALSPGGRMALYAGLAALLVGLAVSHRTTPVSLERRPLSARLVVALLFALLAFGPGPISPVVAIAVAVLLLGALVAVEEVRQVATVTAVGGEPS